MTNSSMTLLLTTVLRVAEQWIATARADESELTL